jgi:hypothetical protein
MMARSVFVVSSVTRMDWYMADNFPGRGRGGGVCV